MKKILIVEDDQLVATAYKKRFREAGYEVDWASDGLEGIKMMGTLKPDIVLLDLLMPRLDGIEVLKYIRAHPDLKNLPVVVFSNSYMTNLVENAWLAGADQCLMKASTTPAQLFDAVGKAMEKAAARATAPAPVGVVAPITPLARPSVGLAPVLAPATAPGTPRSAPVLPGTPGANYNPPIVPRPPRPGPPTPSVTAPVSAPASVEKPGAASQMDVEPEFQAQIRQLFLTSAPAKVATVRDAANAFVLDQGSSMQIPLLGDLFRKVHSLTGNAAVAGCSQIANYASTFEAFLQELQQKPRFINASTARTVVKAVEFVEWLFQQPAESAVAPAAAAAVLVVDANAMSSQAISMAIESGGYQPSAVSDPAQALGALARGSFVSVVIATELLTMSGFELCAQMQALGGHGCIPVLFVSPLAGFLAHSTPEVLGENEVLASPFLLIELTLKTVTQVEGVRLRKYQAAA